MQAPQRGRLSRFGHSINPLYWTPPDEEWMRQQYSSPPNGLGKTQEQIAVEVGCSKPSVDKWIKMYGLREPHSKRHSQRMSDQNHPHWNGGTALQWQRKLMLRVRPPICEWCGDDRQNIPWYKKAWIEVHHRDHNRANNAIENLGWLCHDCNMLEMAAWMASAARDGDMAKGRQAIHRCV